MEPMDIKKVRSEIKCVIYDCDGVLFDSIEGNGRLYNDLCRGIGRPPLTDEEMKYVQMQTVSESIRFITRQEPALEKRALELLKKVDLKDYIVFLKMEPHLLQVLDELGKRGIKRVINTNRTTSMPHIMERFNLRPYFEMVVTALDVSHPKPDPESVEKILSAYDLKKEEVLFVGDSEVDQQTAGSAGIRFVAYKNAAIAEGALIQDHLELLSLV
jgi:phosphoglycolate phosphatase